MNEISPTGGWRSPIFTPRCVFLKRETPIIRFELEISSSLEFLFIYYVIIEGSIIETPSIIEATRRKRTAPTTIIENKFWTFLDGVFEYKRTRSLRHYIQSTVGALHINIYYVSIKYFILHIVQSSKSRYAWSGQYVLKTHEK